jgi:hypothetical protein
VITIPTRFDLRFNWLCILENSCVNENNSLLGSQDVLASAISRGEIQWFEYTASSRTKCFTVLALLLGGYMYLFDSHFRH